MANTGNHAAIARPYAQAVFELAKAAGQLGQWSEVLHAAAAVVSDPQVSRLIGAPATDKHKLVGMIADIAGKAADADAAKVSNLVRLLAENGRLEALPEIAHAYDALKAEVENRVEVMLTTASSVDESQQAKIIEALKKRFGREVSLKVELDENLIGGATLRADDLVIDGSVSTGLDKLATVLAN
ncbi:MAG: F0F1 ATP synthase subunit delta [Gammaproteobacteria bacterium]|jgi:F-type H+-transporting ATPase subunit delta